VLTFLVLGLGTTRIITFETQARVGGIAVILYGAALINLLFWKAIYRRKIPYTIMSFMTLTSVVAIVIGTSAVLINLRFNGNSLLHLSLPPDPWYGNAELYLNSAGHVIGLFDWGIMAMVFLFGARILALLSRLCCLPVGIICDLGKKRPAMGGDGGRAGAGCLVCSAVR